MFEKILLAVDGSEHALHAAEIAGNLARSEASSSLRVIAVYESVPEYLGEPNAQALIDAHMLRAETILTEAVKKVGEIPGSIETEVLSGSPAEVIIAVASAENSDLIVMGSRGLGRLSGLLIGSHSQKVVGHAPCPVLIVR